jgi:hypothetical protein
LQNTRGGGVSARQRPRRVRVYFLLSLCRPFVFMVLQIAFPASLLF